MIHTPRGDCSLPEENLFNIDPRSAGGSESM